MIGSRGVLDEAETALSCEGSPCRSAAIRKDMPSAMPTNAGRTASPTLPLRTVPRALGKGKRQSGNEEQRPERSAIPVKGSTTDAIAEWGNKVSRARPRAVTTPRTIPFAAWI
jgi:hypothetical protein